MEKYLIQQIAMGMQKQWRVWEAEAAIGDRHVAEAIQPTTQSKIRQRST